MSQKVINILKKYGPMLSGKAAHLIENEYHLSNEAARQCLSRATLPVHRLSRLSFEKRQKFIYLEEQFGTLAYYESLLESIQSSSKICWMVLCAFYSQNGYVSKSILPSLVAAPIQSLKGHKLYKDLIADLQACNIITEYSETYWRLSDWAMSLHPVNFNRAVGLETAKKQIVRDFSKWAANINLVSYQSVKSLPDCAEFAHFQWGLTAPSYIGPLYDCSKKTPGFIVGDVFFGQNASLDDIAFFLDKVATVRSFKKIPSVLPVLLVDHVSHEALMLLKEQKVVIGIIQNIFDERYVQLLYEIVRIFTNASAIVSQRPEEVEELFTEIARSDGRYNDLVGDMFELVAGFYYQSLGCRYLDIRRKIQNFETRKKNEIDVLAIREGQLFIVECKAMNAAVDIEFVDRWLSETVVRIREWLKKEYSQYDKVTFQLWSLGGFTDDAQRKLEKAAQQTKKYIIEFYTKDQIVEMAKEKKVKPVVDILQHMRPPLEVVDKANI